MTKGGVFVKEAFSSAPFKACILGIEGGDSFVGSGAKVRVEPGGDIWCVMGEVGGNVGGEDRMCDGQGGG